MKPAKRDLIAEANVACSQVNDALDRFHNGLKNDVIDGRLDSLEACRVLIVLYKSLSRSCLLNVAALTRDDALSRAILDAHGVSADEIDRKVDGEMRRAADGN